MEGLTIMKADFRYYRLDVLSSATC